MSFDTQYAKVLMVGPDVNGMGGISRVISLWNDSSLFSENRVTYIPSVTDRTMNYKTYFLKSYLFFLLSLFRNNLIVYIHTSSNNSFRRKSFFIATALIFQKPVVLHIHPTHFYKFIINLKRLEKRITAILLRNVKLLIVLTQEMRARMQNLFPENSIHVLRNPVDVHGMIISKRIERERNRLLYLGLYIKEKGVYDLVDAIEILSQKGNEVYLDFYGTKGIVELRDYVERKRLKDIITVNPWINEKEKLKALYNATALVLPSYSEGIPNVILEAMATQTPIISTRVGGLREILTNRENAIIVKEGNPLDLSDKILLCLKCSALRNRIASTAYYEVVNMYDISIIKKEFSSILEVLSR